MKRSSVLILLILTALLFVLHTGIFSLALAWGGENFEKLKEEARRGNAKAQYGLGIDYYNGQGVPQDYAQAAYWYRKAADQGDAMGEAGLGILYQYGQGVPRDYAQAAYWYRKAADQGDSTGQADLGSLYYIGQGVPQDYSKALYWYRKAADQGNPMVQTGLGVLYQYGQGVPQDYAQAAYWYRKAADQGDSQGEALLGILYMSGQGVPKDPAQALYWLRKAADQGNAAGQTGLGSLYYIGQGVPQDYSKALYWYRKAADQGNPIALSLLEKLENGLEQQTRPTQDQNTNALILEELQKLKAQLKKRKIPPAEPPALISDIDSPDYQNRPNPHAFALVIGIEHYPGGLPIAEFADHDAKAVYQTMRALGIPTDHIKQLTDVSATRSRIRGALHWLARNVRSDSTVWVYFSGHGAPGNKGTSYLVPFDGDPNDLADTGLKVATLYKQLNELKVRRVIVALDSCFSGQGSRSVLRAGIRPLVTRISPGYFPSSGKIIAFSAAQPDQEAGVLKDQGHGLFTYYFLKGLDTGAVRQGHVTVAKLYRYLKRRVTEKANLDNRGQVPEIQPILLDKLASVRLR